MNLQWVTTDRGEVLRDLDAPENRKRIGLQVNVSKDVSCIACTVPPWTPGAKRYVTDPKSEHYGQPMVTTLREHRNIEAASNGRYVYRYRTDR